MIGRTRVSYMEFVSVNSSETRMHSSRMRTARLLPVSPSMHCSQGVYLVLGGRGVPGPRGCTCPVGGTWSGGCTWSRGCTCLGGKGLGGVPAWGVPGPGVCAWSGGYLALGGVRGPGGGVPGLGGVHGPGDTWSWGVYLVPGGTFPGIPPRGQTDTCKNITFANFVCGR